MKDKIKNLFASSSNSYYSPDSNPSKEPPEKIIKRLQKELDELKNNLPKIASEKFRTRRSIRKFSNKEVPWEIIHDIVECGLNAPAAGNIQNYNIILISDKKKKYELGKLAFQQYWISDAPMLIIIVRDNYHLCEMYPNEGQTYAIQNTAALIENILMMAHFHNLGACWVEAYDNEVLKDFLGIPPEKIVDAIIPVGYPLENPSISKDDPTSKIFFNQFGNKKR